MQLLLATLRPVDGEGRQLKEATPSMLSAHEQALLSREDARSLQPGEVIIDVGEGRNLRVVFEALRVAFYGQMESEQLYDEEHGQWYEDEDVNHPIDELVWALAYPIAIASRWGLFAEERPIEMLPDAKCDKCGAFAFDDEQVCAACGGTLTSYRHDPDYEGSGHLATSDRHEHARQVMDVLLSRGLLELATPRSRPRVEARVTRLLEAHRPASAIMAKLVEEDGVAEVFCDDETLAEIIETCAP